MFGGGRYDQVIARDRRGVDRFIGRGGAVDDHARVDVRARYGVIPFLNGAASPMLASEFLNGLIPPFLRCPRSVDGYKTWRGLNRCEWRRDSGYIGRNRDYGVLSDNGRDGDSCDECGRG